MQKEIIILSLGGSLVVPEEVDTDFLKQFKELILKNIKNKRFVLMVGGGRTCRKYQAALREFTSSDRDIDWMGIYSTWLNARLVWLVFKKRAHPEIVIDPTKKINFKKDILVGGGWKPGWSTDMDAVLLAKNLKIKTVINLTNVYNVYTADPKKDPNARPIEKMCWPEMRKIVGNKWAPGKNVVFDPIAAKLAQKLKLKVIITNGKDLKNLDNLFSGKEFRGTVIED